MSDFRSLRVTVTDASGDHQFLSTGLSEDFTFTVNDYTGELMVERVSYGPRGNDEWARSSATVVGAWPADAWQKVTLHNGATSQGD